MAFMTVGEVQMFEDLGRTASRSSCCTDSLAPVALTGSTRSTFSAPAFASFFRICVVMVGSSNPGAVRR